MLTKNLGDMFEPTRNQQTSKLEMTNITPRNFAKIKVYYIIKSGETNRITELGFICQPQIGLWQSAQLDCEIVG